MIFLKGMRSTFWVIALVELFLLTGTGTLLASITRSQMTEITAFSGVVPYATTTILMPLIYPEPPLCRVWWTTARDLPWVTRLHSDLRWSIISTGDIRGKAGDCQATTTAPL